MRDRSMDCVPIANKERGEQLNLGPIDIRGPPCLFQPKVSTSAIDQLVTDRRQS
jgi:hypothetical protein